MSRHIIPIACTVTDSVTRPVTDSSCGPVTESGSVPRLVTDSSCGPVTKSDSVTCPVTDPSCGPVTESGSVPHPVRGSDCHPTIHQFSATYEDKVINQQNALLVYSTSNRKDWEEELSHAHHIFRSQLMMQVSLIGSITILCSTVT